jgi:hypothetical protein
LNYVHFGAQPADATGRIAITLQGSGGFPTTDPAAFGGIVNGFQIAPVPEPATLLLFAAGALGVLAVHRLQLAGRPK